MKVTIYYDILAVPPRHVLKEKREPAYKGQFEEPQYEVGRYRFAFSQNRHQVLLNPGQTYVMDLDPLTQNSVAPFPVKASGMYLRKEGVTTPFFVIMDDFALDFDEWFRNEPSERREKETSVLEDLDEWRKGVRKQFLIIRREMERCGWRYVLESDPEYLICSSRPNLQ